MAQLLVEVGGKFVEAVASCVVDASGLYYLDPDSLPAAYTYDTDGNLATETRGPDARGFSFKKTYTFTGGRLTAESAWLKQ